MATFVVDASINLQVNFTIKGTITNVDFGDGSPLAGPFTDTTILYSYPTSATYTVTFDSTNLLAIFFQNNSNITSIDVSSSPILIDCFVNGQVFLIDVNVSNCPNLNRLIIDSCYSFDTLDMTGSNSITDIQIRRTKLSSIDLTSKTSIKSLGLGSNKLTSLNLTPCTPLEKFDASNNELSGITFGTHNNLEGVNLVLNKLTSINISTIPNLGSINLDVNNLTSLNISSNPQLQYITLAENQISDINLTPIIVTLDTFGLSGGTLYISNQNPLQTPTPVGLAGISNLQSKGWIVDFENKEPEVDITSVFWPCGSTGTKTFFANYNEVALNGVVYDISNQFPGEFDCGQCVASRYSPTIKFLFPLDTDYETCISCLAYTVVFFTNCLEKQVYELRLSAFTGTLALDDIYYLNFLTPAGGLNPPINNLGCYRVTGFGRENEKTSFSELLSESIEADCQTCLTNNSQTYLVYHCNNFELTHYISLPDDSLIGHLITFNDISTGLEQFCGIVDSQQTGSVDISLVNDLGLYTEELCTQCLSSVAEKRLIVDCLDSEHTEVVWNSIFFESGDVSNLSTSDGCFTVSGLTEADVTIQTFLDFDPQPDCQDCIQCNGVTYQAISLNSNCEPGEAFLITISSYQYLEVGQVIYVPEYGGCFSITSVTPGLATDPYYSLRTFEACEDCYATNSVIWYAQDCTTNTQLPVVLPDNMDSGDVVHIKWGETDFLCVTLIEEVGETVFAPYYSDGITHNNCTTCQSTIQLGLTIIDCVTGVEKYIKVTSEVWQSIAGLTEFGFGVPKPVISDNNYNCYYVKSLCPITVQQIAIPFTPLGYYFNCPQCAADNINPRPPRSANTESFVCVTCCPCDGSSGSTFSITPPHPVWTDEYGTPVTQMNMIVIGGINGLNG